MMLCLLKKKLKLFWWEFDFDLKSQDSIIINENHVDTYVPFVMEDNGNLEKVPFGPLDYDSSDVQSIDWSKADSTFSAD